MPNQGETQLLGCSDQKENTVGHSVPFSLASLQVWETSYKLRVPWCRWQWTCRKGLSSGWTWLVLDPWRSRVGPPLWSLGRVGILPPTYAHIHTHRVVLPIRCGMRLFAFQPPFCHGLIHFYTPQTFSTGIFGISLFPSFIALLLNRVATALQEEF